MIDKTTALSIFSKLISTLGLSLILASCGFHLQGQSQANFPASLSVHIDEAALVAPVTDALKQQGVNLEVITELDADTAYPLLSLNRTLKNRSELILDQNGDVLIWRYTLTTNYLYRPLAPAAEDNDQPSTNTASKLSVTTDVDLSGSQATVNERIEADSWALLYRQLSLRIQRQLGRE